MLEGTVAGIRYVGVEEGIDRREAIVEDVDDADHARPSSSEKRDQSRVDAALQQEVGVLLVVVLIHAAAGMACVLVAQIEGVVLGVEIQRQLADGQILVSFARRGAGFTCRRRTGRPAGAPARTCCSCRNAGDR